jgi:hypothetical protein
MAVNEDAVQTQIRTIDQGVRAALQNNFVFYHRLVDALLLSGRQACWAMPRDRQIADLSEIEFKVFSQWGEDGIIEWLVSHVDVPNRRFVEFGVESFQEAHCRFLMLNRNWRGFVMDGNEANIAGLRADPLFWKYDLSALSTFVTVENINGLLERAGFSGPLGLLSIDIDGNDYWVWKAISVVSPAIVVCEFNAVLGNTQPIAIPYQAGFRRFDSHFSGLYFGCSISALQHLALEKGYQFVGTNSHGVNAFFVRNDLAAPVLSLLREQRAFPSRTRESRDANGRLNYVRGYSRLELIQHLPVVDVVTGKTLSIRDVVKPYTDDWLLEIS